MSKLSTLKDLLQKALLAFAKVSTDKGLLSYASDGELPLVDEAIMIVDEEGNESKPEDGDYALEDKTIIVIADGRVKEIRKPDGQIEEDKPAEVQPAPVPVEESKKKVCAEEEVIVEEPVAEDPKDAKIKALEAEIAEKVAEIEKGKAEIEELKARIAELEKEPAAPAAEEVFKQVSNSNITGDERLGNLRKFINAK